VTLSAYESANCVGLDVSSVWHEFSNWHSSKGQPADRTVLWTFWWI